ncbi:MAG: hypothetical protein ABJC63_12895 [Gemmatimonadales bacterium]
MITTSERRFLPARWLLYATVLYGATSLVYFVAPILGDFSRVFLGTTPFPHDTVLNAGILEMGFSPIV